MSIRAGDDSIVARMWRVATTGAFWSQEVCDCYDYDCYDYLVSSIVISCVHFLIRVTCLQLTSEASGVLPARVIRVTCLQLTSEASGVLPARVIRVTCLQLTSEASGVLPARVLALLFSCSGDLQMALQVLRSGSAKTATGRC